MNIVFSSMLIISVVLILITRPESLMSFMIQGTQNAITLSFKLLAIYAICMAIIDIMDKIKLSQVFTKLLRPITRRLFKGEDDKTQELISLNFTTNMLGMGGAATPLGIRAVERMSGNSTRATDNAILFLVINATSIQLLPTTIIGIRSAAASQNASDIILPSLIATTVATFVGIVLAKVLRRE